MKKRIALALAAPFTAAMLLAGCGGGGGGGGGGGIALPLPGIKVALTGTATYESVPNKTGALVYSETEIKPVRGAYVEVVDASANPLASTTTDDSGAYSVQVPANTDVIVRVRAQSIRTGAGPTWDVSVRDNTRSGALYSMQSAKFPTGTAALTRDLRAPSGWGGSRYSGERVAAPFAVLDTVYGAMQKVVSAAPATAFPALKVFWSVDNAPSATSNLPSGQIVTSHFRTSGTGPEIYVLGKQDVDTDEFDASVIAHEWGHYYQSSFSRDDSPGGPHAQHENVDRRLAFSEGWGNGWSGMALARRNYVDSQGAHQAQGNNIDLTAGPPANPGWFREWSLQSVFWNLHQQVGFKPIHDAMTSASFKGGAAVSSIHSFTAAFNAASPTHAATLNSLLTAQNITAGNDPFGPDERNDGGVSLALPLYVVATPGVDSAVCVAAVTGNSNNKLGHVGYLRFTVPAGNRQFIVKGTSGSNPDYEIYRAGQLPNGTRNLPAGEYVMAVRDLAKTSACFNVTIQ